MCPQLQTVYVNQGRPIGLQTGEMLRPWLASDSALAYMPDGVLLSIVERDYTVSSGTINQHVTITAPVGPVVIRGPE